MNAGDNLTSTTTHIFEEVKSGPESYILLYIHRDPWMNKDLSFSIYIQVKEKVTFVKKCFSFYIVLKCEICNVLVCSFLREKHPQVGQKKCQKDIVLCILGIIHIKKWIPIADFCMNKQGETVPSSKHL